MSDEIPILLLGGSSFLGLQTAETLFYFYDVYCTYNSSYAPKYYSEFNWFQVDFLDQDKSTFKRSIKRLIEKTGVKYVVNFAGISSPLDSKLMPESKKINELANYTIAETCSELNAVPIFISSDHVFNGHKGPYAEDVKPNPLKNSVYGNQKYHAELIYQNEPKYAVLRVSTTIGSNLHFQKPNLYVKTLGKLRQKKEVIGATNKLRTATHCWNVAFMINKIIEGFDQERLEKGIFHVPGEFTSEYELLKKIAITHNLDPDLVKSKEISEDEESYPLKLGLESKQSVSTLKGRYLTLDEGLYQLNYENLI